MPPQLALLLCLIFVGLLLRFESRQVGRMGLAQWIPTLWLLYCASKPVAVWLAGGLRQAGGDEGEGGSVADRNFMVMLIVVGLGVLVRRRVTIGEAIRQNPWLAAIMAYTLCSVLWSDYSVIALKRWIRLFGTCTMALIVTTDENPAKALMQIARRTVFILIPFSVLVVKYFPHLGIEFNRFNGAAMWVGVTTQKNGLGRLCIVSLLILLCAPGGAFSFDWKDRTKAWKCLWFVLIAMSGWLLRAEKGGYSANSLLALACGLGVWAFLRFADRASLHVPKSMPALATVSVIGLGTLLPFVGPEIAAGVASLVNRDATFTGRADIWAALIPYVWRNPILGSGYDTFWLDAGSVTEATGVAVAHNGYLEVLLNLGGIGLLLLSGYVLAIVKAATAGGAAVREINRVGLALVVMALVYNCAEAAFLVSTGHLWALLVFLGCTLGIQGGWSQELEGVPVPA